MEALCYNAIIMNYIYALKDPRDNEVKYIGKTSSPRRRLTEHLSQSSLNKYPQTKVKEWIKEVKALGLKPIMSVLESVESNWQSQEKFWINQFRENGARLLNHTDGGEGLTNCSESTKERLRANNKKNLHIYQTPEFRAKISKFSKALIRTPEHCRKISESKKGKPRSPETILKIANSKRKPVGKFSLSLEFIERYPSSLECSIENKIDRSWLIKQIKKDKPVKGYIYKYL